MKYTPGPWRYIGADVQAQDESGDWSLTVASLNFIPSDDSTESEQVDADGALIAAAPELLDALENLLLEIEAQAIHAPARRALAIKAIKKARGES